MAEKYGKTLLLNISKNVTGLLVDVDAWSTGIDVSYPGCVADAEDGEEEGEGEEEEEEGEGEGEKEGEGEEDGTDFAVEPEVLAAATTSAAAARTTLATLSHGTKSKGDVRLQTT